ncbi:ATP-binding cassette domain-containing protein [Epidermidibacterium keratini]|uniref:ATP-binding cassette domain-containing protein n=1 Tax=Epidermidibacterium keratini TaxID=1891644 RepID=A0A7L4YN63_9ACTN|nr:ABC transporter ATP-binding protein [Epidermidibacterium keratini]QHC00715.1 ATP-binding cassette domain-containing protein [Epidermidibacterium keratini]
MSAAIEVSNVSKRFRLYRDRNQSLKATILRGRRAKYEEFWALDDVSFEIPVGSTYGIIGENGSGKSTMLKCIANILRPDRGEIQRHGRIAALLELGSGFHPELSGRENVYLNGSILGLSRSEIDAAFDSIVAFSGIEQFIDQPVKNYSSGMYVRLGFAIAIHVEPEILLVDEILAVGDAAFQKKCMEKFSQFREEGRTVVMVSHAMGSLKEMCDHVAWFDHGKLIDDGPAIGIVDQYLSDTTQDRIEDPATDADVAEYGSGEIVVERIDLIDSRDERTLKFHTGEPMRMRIHYNAHEPVKDVAFGISVHTATGVHLWSVETSDKGVKFGTLQGRGTIELDVPRLLFNPGVFDVWANVTDAKSHHEYHMVRKILRFDVVPGKIHEGIGLMVLDADFKQTSVTA